MRAAFAMVLAVCLGGCLPPVNAEIAELAWERCDGPGDSATRLSECSSVINFEGTSPERRAAALIVRGSIRSNDGDYPRALADFGRALRIDSNNAQVYFERGVLYQARGIYENAARDFDQALALEPGLRPALDRRAEIMQQMASAYLRELEALDNYLRTSPTDADLLNSRCWIRAVNNDNLDLALADCNASLLAEPNDANVHDSRGLVHLKRGDYAASLADYEAAVRLEPERGHFLYGRGLARIALGLTAEGHADLTRAEELEPGVTADYAGYNIEMPMLVEAPKPPK
ncbi:MAG: tetratricopeptide repeat protein [Hyphomonadaceae bacterium]